MQSTPHIGANYIGVDKLNFSVREFSVKNAEAAGLTMVHGKTDLSTKQSTAHRLFKDDTGWQIASNAFLNNDLYSLNIDFRGLQVVFNPSKPWDLTKLCSETEVLADRLQMVWKEIRKKGIIANFHNACIDRLDLAANQVMAFPCSAYAPVFGALQIPYGRQQKEFPDGFGMGNNQFYFQAYNLLASLRARKKSKLKGDNFMRQELQFKKKRKITSEFGLRLVHEVLDTGIPSMAKHYKVLMEEKIYKMDKMQSANPSLSFDNKLLLLIDLKQRYPRTGIDVFLKLHSLDDLLRHVGIKGYGDLIRAAGFHRNIAIRRMQELRKLNVTKSAFHHRAGFSTLFQEMYQKFVA